MSQAPIRRALLSADGVARVIDEVAREARRGDSVYVGNWNAKTHWWCDALRRAGADVFVARTIWPEDERLDLRARSPAPLPPATPAEHPYR